MYREIVRKKGREGGLETADKYIITYI